MLLLAKWIQHETKENLRKLLENQNNLNKQNKVYFLILIAGMYG